MANTALFDAGLDAAALFDLPKPASECRIVVAMSGGVDSSVVAALAAASGADGIAVSNRAKRRLLRR